MVARSRVTEIALDAWDATRGLVNRAANASRHAKIAVGLSAAMLMGSLAADRHSRNVHEHAASQSILAVGMGRQYPKMPADHAAYLALLQKVAGLNARHISIVANAAQKVGVSPYRVALTLRNYPDLDAATREFQDRLATGRTKNPERASRIRQVVETFAATPDGREAARRIARATRSLARPSAPYINPGE